MAVKFIRMSLVAGAALIPISPALAQPKAAVPAASSSSKRVYLPADFVRFAPKTAYDMLAQVPSFTIRSADQERGLGQASENVLVNGQRVTNKSGGAIDQLQRTSAQQVERIEIVEAASLGIPGLSGQVANVILKATGKGTGQFEWNGNFRTNFTEPEFMGGSLSYSNKVGPVDYTLSVKNQSGRGGIGGPVELYDVNHVLIESRDEVYHSESEQMSTQLKLAYDGPGSSLGNLTLGYTPYWNPQYQSYDGRLLSGETTVRSNTRRLNGYYADINGDYEFALGPGRLKLIGLRHWEHEPILTTDITRFTGSGSPSIGSRFSRDTHLGETIGRAEYRWKSGKNDWQISLERAFNSLDQKGDLFELDGGGQFQPVALPDGSGKVTETRYELIGTLSRPLAANLDLQVAAGGEISRLDRNDDDRPARKFFRPKGSVTLAWRPAEGWDVSLKLRRRVGQISFYDFLAQPQLSQDRENAGNPDLVPPQSTEIETEFARDLGRWGKTRLNFHYYRVTDIVDVIPIGTDGQGIGNLPHAFKFGAESTSTINLDPLGWHGAKLDLNAGSEWTGVKDPLTGRNRPITGNYDHWGNIQVRDDIPNSHFAWSAFVQYNHYAKNYYLTEIYSELDLPWLVGFYIEDKDFLGLTVRGEVDNVFNGRHWFYRTVYSGFRDQAPIAFTERHDDLVGPIFKLSVKGTF
ncbi:MAG: TonB-dependent receptor plug domain-containing protein [Sphingomicrobium sp.]